MAEGELRISGIVAILTVVLVVVGLIIALFWFFKRSENLSEEDRLNIERVKVAWIGAVALGVLTLAAAKWDKRGGMKMSMSMGGGSARGSSTLL